jgi:hypothetical protein
VETVDDLEELDRELRSHFAALRARRDVVSAGAPLFALEHNLDDEFLEFLKGRVREAIQSGPPSGRSPLPYIVYAAEVGYRYEDEYWPSFEASTPGWLQHGDRYWIRRVFTEFADKYGGARPTGAWGRQFSIISWPITNAILPTDLQRHLARLLADHRHRLSPDLITNPDELGLRLAGHAATTSARFRVFAQNTSLLGLVAASLLLGDESESPLLERKTLDRIVVDLSAEEESRRWLKAARDTALPLQLRGQSDSVEAAVRSLLRAWSCRRSCSFAHLRAGQFNSSRQISRPSLIGTPTYKKRSRFRGHASPARRAGRRWRAASSSTSA